MASDLHPTHRILRPRCRAVWDQFFPALEEFHRQHGHSNVPFRYSVNPELGNWVGRIRYLKRKGRLDAQRIAALEKIGFCWALRQPKALPRDWDAMLAALAHFKRRFGHCSVSRCWPMNPALGGWLHDARRRKKCGTLSARQVDQLEQLGVVWEPIRSHWEKMFAALVEFCQTHGHCRVPVALPPDAKLGRWTHTQRVRRKQGKLDADRVSRLDALGFSWDVPVEQWETMFAALLAYKEAHGSFNVPLKWSVSPGAPRLGSWVISQRVAFWEGRLDPQRAERLAAIGFQWGSVPRSRSSGETSDPVPPVGRDKHVDGVTDFQSNEIALLPGMAGASLNP